MKLRTVTRVTNVLGVTLGLGLLPAALGACDDGGSDPAATNTGGNGNGGGNGGGEGAAPDGLTCDEAAKLCTLEGEYTKDLHLTADWQYLLKGGVFIGDDTAATTLTIDAGTTIFGDSGASVLVIRRGAKIMAEGTKDAPIVFTSAREDGKRNRGDWGGLVVNGRARLNSCAGAADPCTAEGEGDTGSYGGSDDGDSSGTLKYVRVEFAGYQITADNELNGIAFQAVGSGTTVDYLHLHMNADDGVEFFGGAVNVKHVLVTGSGDDSLDWTDGWRGNAQYVVVQQYEDECDNGIEADNLKADNTAEPRSNPMISNITLIGSPDSTASDIGILLREGTGIHLTNALIVGFNEACVDVDNEETFTNGGTPGAETGDLVIENTWLSCKTTWNPPADGETDPWSLADFFGGMAGVGEGDPMLSAPHDTKAPGFAPKSGSPALSGGQAPTDSFFDATTWIGGVGPDEDWTAGWTTFPRS